MAKLKVLHVGAFMVIQHYAETTLRAICETTGGIMLQVFKRALPWILAALLFGLGWHTGSDSKDAHWKEVLHNEYVSKVEATRETQAAVDLVATQYQDDLAALEGSSDRVINDLRGSNKRLYVKLKAKPRGTEGVSGCLADGRAELDDSTARDIIKVTQRGDAWIKALQGTIRELQKEDR